MSSLLSADLAAACNALGYFDVKSNKYYADANTLETVKDLIRYLRRDDENHDIRRHLGETAVLQTDLLPLLKSYWEEEDLFDVLLRLIVNLTTPALILWNEQLPTEKTVRNYYLQVEGHLQNYKEAFADEAVWAVLSTRLSKILEIEPIQRGDENSLIIERILILIRNILYVPADSMEKRPDNDASIHDQVLWALHQSGMLDIILYITSSPTESAYYLHILEILTFMLREQKASELAHAALQRSQTEKVRDEAELLAIRHKEISQKQKKANVFSGTRHSRFGGTFVVKSMKSISDNELIYHKPLNKLGALNFDADKIKPKTPKNRLPVKAAPSERRSAFSIRLFLKEFCVEFLNGAYNTLMYHVKDNLVRAKAQAHDESYYLWAMRFFMEFNRCYKFEVKLVSETMSVQTFHYVQQQSENFYDMMATDKKKMRLWSRRLHLALLAYRELFMTLSAMDKSTDVNVRDSSRVIKSNIFYVLEYREFILTLLVNYDELKMSDVYLKDLMETQHVFLKMLESFVGRDGTVVVQSKSKKRRKKQGKKAPQRNEPIIQALDLDTLWDEVSPQLSSILENSTEFPSDIAPFDAASDVPIDDQKADAMKIVQRKLRTGHFESAIDLLRAAREVWPENDSFGSPNMAPEEEFLALRDIFYADLGGFSWKSDTNSATVSANVTYAELPPEVCRTYFKTPCIRVPLFEVTLLSKMGSRVGGHGTAGLPADKALAGVPRLLDDLQRLSEDTDSADIVFLLGREEERVYAHRVILMARCKSFQTAKRGEICRIPGCTVSPAAPGTPTPVRLPQIPPETFKQFLLYVYTGKILLQDSGVFEMMALAQELGVDELRNACEDHVTSTLSVPSACTFLATAMDIQDRSAGGKATASFIERCVTYVGENAAECVRTNSFLSLPKEAVIKLISSDYLCLEEEDVWRAVLNWAKYQAGVTQPTAHWTEEERARVCQQLSYVINHVRLLLIDSQVFAEEVEPTGAVPMELSLERYRHAALPSKYPEASEDQRLKPRVSPHLFPGSLIIGQDKSHYQRILNAWSGHPKQTWRLIYRASSHGYSASAFHRHCDGVSPTYVIVLGARGEICGGFTDSAWARPPGKSRYIAADRAFLFTLFNHQDLPPTQFHLVKKPFAICYHPDSGPIFGAGADLLISSNCNSNMDSYSNLPHTYDGDGASSSILMGDYNFAVADYEVFTPINCQTKYSKGDRYQ